MIAPLSAYPGMSRFVLDWLSGNGDARRFLPRVVERDLRVLPRSADLRRALDNQNRGWGIQASAELERWSSGSTRTLIAGQQVGFAGGPLYTLAKLASLVKMKRDLESAGQPATAFFWLATEDHDFDEVAQLALPVEGQQQDLVWLRARRTAPERTMVGPLEVPETLKSGLADALGIDLPSWLRPGITFRDSFAELVAEVTGGEVVLIDALLPELRRAGAPLFDAIFDRWNEVQRTVAERSAALTRAGYAPQVLSRDGEQYSLLFEMSAGERRLVEEPRAVESEMISTSALTRPLLQDFVFGTDIFIGGPAEVSYYAQIAPLHELLGMAPPRVALRGHAFVVPHGVRRAMDRWALSVEDALRPADETLAGRESDGVKEIDRIASGAKAALLEDLARIGELALPADHSIARSYNRSVGHIEYHFEKFRQRATRALARKDRERFRAVRRVVGTLHPDGHVQDRVVSWFALWQAHRERLFETLVHEIDADAASVKVVTI